MTKSRGLITPRRRWSSKEDALLRERYADTRLADLAAHFDCAPHVVHTRARALGLKKPLEWIARRAHEVSSDPHHGGRRTQFQPGQLSPHKGTRRPGYSIGRGRMQETTFKKGEPPHNIVPIGTEAIRAGGYVWVKVRNDLRPARLNWLPKARVVYAAAHGAIPDGHMVEFRDGNRRNFALANLECVSKAEHQRRHSIHNYPPEIVSVTLLRARVVRQINKRQPPVPARRGRPPKHRTSTSSAA